MYEDFIFQLEQMIENCEDLQAYYSHEDPVICRVALQGKNYLVKSMQAIQRLETLLKKHEER